MITKAIQVTIFVKDLEDAKSFYTEKLGFVVVTEIELAPDWKYLTVSPSRDNETVIELASANTPEEKALVGKQAGVGRPLIMFATDDIDSDYQALTERGVVFNIEPHEVPVGRGAIFRDLYGNQFDLVQLNR